MARDRPSRTGDPASSDDPAGDKSTQEATEDESTREAASEESTREVTDERTSGDGEASFPTRREYLKVVGAATVPTALAGCGSQSSPRTSTTAEAGEETEAEEKAAETDQSADAADGPTNIVEAGADESGEKPINEVLKEVHGDDVEIRFPPGRYLLDPVTLSGSGWTLTGDDATLVVPSSVDRTYLSFEGSDWTVDGFTVDLSADGAAPTNYLLGTDWEFKNVEFVGQMDDPQYRGDSDLLYPAVKSADATGLIENVSAMDGSADPGKSSNRGLTWFGPNNEGKLIWRGCRFSKWANNTLYAAESAGPVLIEECLFENTNVGVRIGGNTVVRDCLWRQDGRVPTQRWTGDSNGRGLWLNSNGYAPGPIEIVGCDFVMTGEDAVAAIRSSHRVDDVTIRDTHIRQSYEESAIELPGSGSATIRNVSITGSITKSAIDIWDRDESVVAETCIRQPGDGVRITDSDDCRVENSTVNVEGRKFVFEDSSVATEGISESGGCPAPNGSSPAADG